MFNHETRPSHFLIPTAIVVIGGVFIHLQGWEYVGYAIWGVAAGNLFFLIYSAIKDQELKRIQEEHYHFAEIIRMDAAKSSTKVIVDKTALEGNSFSQSNTTLAVDPAKVKIFALKVLDGFPLTIREWTPIKDGKLFSDGEWRRLISFMKQPVTDRPDIKFVVQINPNDERKGFELTPAGQKWLENVVETRILTPAVT